MHLEENYLVYLLIKIKKVNHIHIRFIYVNELWEKGYLSAIYYKKIIYVLHYLTIRLSKYV